MDILENLDANAEEERKMRERRKQKQLMKKRKEQELAQLKSKDLEFEKQRMAVLQKVGLVKEPKVQIAKASAKRPSPVSSAQRKTVQTPKSPPQPRAMKPRKSMEMVSSDFVLSRAKGKQPKSRPVEEPVLEKKPSEDVIYGKKKKKLKVKIDETDEVFDYGIKQTDLILGQNDDNGADSTVQSKPKPQSPQKPKPELYRKPEAPRPQVRQSSTVSKRPSKPIQKETRQSPTSRSKSPDELQKLKELQELQKKLIAQLKKTESQIKTKTSDKKVAPPKREKPAADPEEKLRELMKQLEEKKRHAAAKEKRRQQTTYDPTDRWSDQEQPQCSSRQPLRERPQYKQRPMKRRKIHTGFGGQTYVYRSSSADEGESELEEARQSDIDEEEEFTRREGEREDEEERQRQRLIKKRRKQKQLRLEGIVKELDEISSDPTSDDDYY